MSAKPPRAWTPQDATGWGKFAFASIAILGFFVMIAVGIYQDSQLTGEPICTVVEVEDEDGELSEIVCREERVPFLVESLPSNLTIFISIVISALVVFGISVGEQKKG